MTPAITIRICRINKAFDQWIWLCGTCARDKKKDGYTVEPKEVVSAEFPCDVCHRSAQKASEAA